MLTLNDDGTATVQLVARELELRRPSIIEYRTLRESVEKLAAVHAQLQEDAQRRNDEYRTSLLSRPEEFDVEEWAVKEQRSRDDLRAVQDSADDLRLKWFREVVETLGGPVEDAEIPSLVYDARWPIELQTHWRTRPLVRGGQ